jgi:cofilin
MADANYPMNPDCMEVFNTVKNPQGNAQFVIFKVENEHIAVENVGPADAPYSQFVSLLPPNEPRFGVYDYDYRNEEGYQRNKLLFIFWTPDTVPSRMKMVYATGVKGLIRRLQGIQKEVQATDLSEVQASAIEASFRFA